MKYIFYLVLLSSLINLSLFSQEPTGLQLGDTAPNFSGLDQNNRAFNLYESLEEQPVVLFFYRGEWCPHCNRYLSAIQDSLSLIHDKGVTVIAVAPQLPENAVKTAEKTGASFPLIYDENYEIMNAYRVSFNLDTKTIKKYKQHGINLEKINGDDSNSLPVPATYIIGQDGKITFVYFNTNYKYRYRATVKDILENL